MAGSRLVHLCGPVQHGDARGRTLGFPTANVRVESVSGGDALGPGVWAGWARWKHGPWYMAVVNVGMRPTFGGETCTIEAHLIDYLGDLYGRTLELRLVARLRDECRFDRIEALVKQIQADVEQARTLLARRPANTLTEVEKWR